MNRQALRLAVETVHSDTPFGNMRKYMKAAVDELDTKDEKISRLRALLGGAAANVQYLHDYRHDCAGDYGGCETQQILAKIKAELEKP